MALSTKKKIVISLCGFAVLLTVILVPVLVIQSNKEEKATQQANEALAEAEREARLAKFHMYADTAHEALEQIRAFANENGVRLPLFEDLTAKPVKKSPKICVGIQTAARQASPINYVEQTVGALLARMSLPADDVYIHVFNVQNVSVPHKDIETVADLVPVTRAKGKLPETLVVKMRPQFAEAHDHREAMRALKKIGCQYPILIEDDALPQEGWLDMVRMAINQLEERGTDWFVVKLYVSHEPGYERENTDYVGITDYDQTFNGVAMMYNPLHMLNYGDALVHHTREVMAGRLDEKLYEFKDTYLNNYQKDTGMKVEAFEPPIFQHTGIYSSVNVRPLDKFDWYMESREFVSQDLPILFNASMWQGLVKTMA